MSRIFTDYYHLFYAYFTEFAMDYEAALKAYGMQPGGKYNPATYSRKWSTLKKENPEDYEDAKKDYLDRQGISESFVMKNIMDIAMFAARDSDKLRALELLMRYLKLGVENDKMVLQAMDSLKIEVVKPTTPADMLEVDNES